jgi:hypothetical protein
MKVPVSSSRDDFNAQVKLLESLNYRERRYALWHHNKPRLPRYIYKFRAFDASDSTSIERIRDILVHCRLRLASPGEFNDPFDMMVNIVIEGPQAEIRKRLETICKERGMKWADRRKEVSLMMRNLNDEGALRTQELFRASISKAGVCSFGGNPRSILMWSHYTDYHRGVCPQFEVARDLSTFAQALPVNYSQEYPVLNWVNESESITGKLLTKFVGWDYEEERRIIIQEAAGQFIDFRPAALAGIIIGCSASNKTVDKLKEIIGERSSLGYPTPKLYLLSNMKSDFD